MKIYLGSITNSEIKKKHRQTIIIPNSILSTSPETLCTTKAPICTPNTPPINSNPDKITSTV